MIDKGPGIPEELQPRLFKKFSQVTQSGHSHRGSGLGLALVKNYIERMQGRVGVESVPSVLTRFYFELAKSG